VAPVFSAGGISTGDRRGRGGDRSDSGVRMHQSESSDSTQHCIRLSTNCSDRPRVERADRFDASSFSGSVSCREFKRSFKPNHSRDVVKLGHFAPDPPVVE